MSDVATSLRSAPTPRIEYRQFDAHAPLPKDVLCAVAFGDAPAAPRRSALRARGAEAAAGRGHHGGVARERAGHVRVRRRAALRGGCGSPARRHRGGRAPHGGIAGAAECAYAALSRFVASSRHPHLLRIWNYLDGINRGGGDEERYKLFCIGPRCRAARVLRSGEVFPAATCIGRRDGNPTLQVYWLAGRAPGVPLENPRQMSAYRYPARVRAGGAEFLASDAGVRPARDDLGHGEHRGPRVPPSGRRARAARRDAHESVERAAAGGRHAPAITPRLGAESLLKFYLRDAALLPEVEALIRERLPPHTQSHHPSRRHLPRRAAGRGGLPPRARSSSPRGAKRGEQGFARELADFVARQCGDDAQAGAG